MESTVTNTDEAVTRGAAKAGVVGRMLTGHLRGRLVIIERVTKFAAFLRELPEQRDVDGEDIVISMSTPRATATSPYVELDTVDPLTLSAVNRAFLTRLTGGDYGPIEEAVEATRAAGRTAQAKPRDVQPTRQKPSKRSGAGTAGPDDATSDVPEVENDVVEPAEATSSTSDDPADSERRDVQPTRQKPSKRSRTPKDVKYLTAGDEPVDPRRAVVWRAARDVQPGTRDQIVDRACQDAAFQKKSSRNMVTWYIKTMLDEGALTVVADGEQV